MSPRPRLPAPAVLVLTLVLTLILPLALSCAAHAAATEPVAPLPAGQTYALELGSPPEAFEVENAGTRPARVTLRWSYGAGAAPKERTLGLEPGSAVDCTAPYAVSGGMPVRFEAVNHGPGDLEVTPY